MVRPPYYKRTFDRWGSTRVPDEPSDGRARVRVFIDFWNLQITLNQQIQHVDPTDAFKIDWSALPRWLAREAATVVGTEHHSYDGAHVYSSYNPLSASDVGLRWWLTTWLDRQPGVQVVLKERRPKDPPTCPSCHQSVPSCPACKASLARTVEKGVDTAIVTDMIRLAWERAYDVGVIVSSDADLVPVVEFLDSKGLRMVQAGFPPIGSDLATACWGSFDVLAGRESFRRT